LLDHFAVAFEHDVKNLFVARAADSVGFSVENPLVICRMALVHWENLHLNSNPISNLWIEKPCIEMEVNKKDAANNICY